MHSRASAVRNASASSSVITNNYYRAVSKLGPMLAVMSSSSAGSNFVGPTANGGTTTIPMASALSHTDHFTSSYLPFTAQRPLQLSRTLARYKQPLPSQICDLNVYAVAREDMIIEGGDQKNGALVEEQKGMRKEGREKEEDFELKETAVKKKKEEGRGNDLSSPSGPGAPGLGLGVGVRFMRGAKWSKRRHDQGNLGDRSSKLYSFPSALLLPSSARTTNFPTSVTSIPLSTSTSTLPSLSLSSSSLSQPSPRASYSTSTSTSTSSASSSSSSSSSNISHQAAEPVSGTSFSASHNTTQAGPNIDVTTPSSPNLTTTKPSFPISKSTKNRAPPMTDEEIRERMEEIAGLDGGVSGLELEDGKPVAMKRSVKNNMFRYI